MSLSVFRSTGAFGLVLLAACGETTSEPIAQPAAPAPVAAPTPPAAPPAAEPTPDTTPARLARVEEVIPSTAYTFVRMDACGTEAWVAGPPTELTVGQVVEMPEGMVMTDFHAASLDRTFDMILFVDFLNPTDKQPQCAKPVKATDDQFVGRVVETMDGGGYTYARLDMCGQEQWVAGPQLPLQVGQTLLAVKGSEMKDFASPSLGRSFPSISFVPKMKAVPGAPYCGDG